MQCLNFTVKFSDVILLFFYLTCLLLGVLYLPKEIEIYYESRSAWICLGILGIWRYSWWLLHIARSLIYSHIVFPARRVKADLLWQEGWRPETVYFMMTTYQELPSITQKVLQSIVDEILDINVPAKLFIGTGFESDEMIIRDFFNTQPVSILEVMVVRQKKPGKRYAIGETLRTMVKQGLQENDPVIFMDGDTYFSPHCLQKCLPFFSLFPDVHAITTYENAILLNGPLWMKKWLEMRFTQRDFTMKSYSLSNKVLTLTGRMSVFRAKWILDPEFINIIEEDYLQHWLWGKFRFLSGDDKSTWYYLLKQKAQMLYIPDATTITLENIKGNPFDRMYENIRRWSGNTLRNGARAIALGPNTVGYFIWWCLVDQRLSIWTLFIGHSISVVLALTKTWLFLLVSLLWIAFSRLLIATTLFYHSRRLDMSFPFLIYLNQLMSTIVKIYILFRLPQQKWKNRGEQQIGFQKDFKMQFRHWTANYLTFFYCFLILICVFLYLNIIHYPGIDDLIAFCH